MVSWVSGQESWLMRLKGLGFLKTWGGEGRVRGGRVTCRNPPQCGQGRPGVQEVLLQQRGPAEPGVHCHLSFRFWFRIEFSSSCNSQFDSGQIPKKPVFSEFGQNDRQNGRLQGKVNILGRLYQQCFSNPKAGWTH